MLTPADEIQAIGKLGDWLKVRLDNNPAPEAWMLSVAPDGRILLVPKGPVKRMVSIICCKCNKAFPSNRLLYLCPSQGSVAATPAVTSPAPVATPPRQLPAPPVQQPVQQDPEPISYQPINQAPVNVYAPPLQIAQPVFASQPVAQSFVQQQQAFLPPSGFPQPDLGSQAFGGPQQSE